MINKSKAAVVLTMASMIAGAHVAHAATNEELEQRLDRLQQLLDETRAELQQQNSQAASASTSSNAGQGASASSTTQAQSGTSNQNKPEQQVAQQKKTAGSGSKPETAGYHIAPNTTATIGGFVKADANTSHYDNGDVSKRNELFYTVGGIPVGPDSKKSTDSTQATAQQTRIHLTTLTNIGDYKIKGFVEADFYGDEAEGQDRVVNDYAPRLRHAYIELNDTWLFGQTWTNFMDLGAYPETLDFIGPTEGQIFVRQTQVRYTHGGFTASVENPETTFEFDPGPADARVTSPTNSDHYPDVTLGYTQKEDWGHISAGALAKVVSTTGDFDASTGVRNTNDTQFGYGLRVSGSYDLTQAGDDVKFQGYYGDGLGRYVAIGAVPAGYVRPNGHIDTIKVYGGYLDYLHNWSKQWRSNLVLGALGVNNPRGLDNSLVTRNAESVHANLLWSPVDPLTLGGELLYATRQVENGFDGNFERFQLSAKYDF